MRVAGAVAERAGRATGGSGPGAGGREQYQAGLARERDKDWNAAAAAYSEALRLAPGMAEAHDRLGYVLGQLGRTDEALDEFRRAVEANPKLFDAQYHLGATLWWTKDPAARSCRCARPSRCGPSHAEARYYLGAALRQTGELEAAVATLREAVRLNPRIVVAQVTARHSAPGAGRPRPARWRRCARPWRWPPTSRTPATASASR